MLKLEKRIITWKWGDNPTNDKYTVTRAFIFGNYGYSAEQYLELVAEAQKDFPALELKDIEIGRVTESSYMKGFKLVTFLLPDNTTHEAYESWDRFDFRH